MAQILRDAGLSELVESGEVECLARGFEFTEGPLWCPDGSLLFQDNKAERTYRLDPDRSVHLLRDQTGAANGQTFGPDGRIVFCEQNGRRVSRMNRDGTGVETLAETWSGKRLNSPNDIVCRSDGIAYFTDPPYGVKPADRELHFQGVFSLDLRPGATGQGGLEPQLLVDDFEKPNGLAFSPDERILYICDTARYHIRAFDVEPSGTLRVGSGRALRPDGPGDPGRPRRGEGRPRRAGVCRRRAGRLGLRARRPPAGHHRRARPAGEPGLVRSRRPRPGADGRRRRLPRPPAGPRG